MHARLITFTALVLALASASIASPLGAPARSSAVPNGQPVSWKRWVRPPVPPRIDAMPCLNPARPACWPGPMISVTPLEPGSRSNRTGSLQLRVVPFDAEVYIDGVYGGTTEAFEAGARRGELAPGSHDVEIRSRGYAPLRFHAQIERGQATTFRGALQPAVPPTPVP